MTDEKPGIYVVTVTARVYVWGEDSGAACAKAKALVRAGAATLKAEVAETPAGSEQAQGEH